MSKKFKLASEKDTRTELSLSKEDGNIFLKADGWYVFRFEGDGRVTCMSGIPKSLGFELDEEGEVEVYSED